MAKLLLPPGPWPRQNRQIRGDARLTRSTPRLVSHTGTTLRKLPAPQPMAQDIVDWDCVVEAGFHTCRLAHSGRSDAAGGRTTTPEQPTAYEQHFREPWPHVVLVADAVLPIATSPRPVARLETPGFKRRHGLVGAHGYSTTRWPAVVGFYAVTASIHKTV